MRRPSLAGIFAACVLLLTAYLLVVFEFGSLRNLRLYANGQTVVVNEPVRDLGDVPVDKEVEVVFPITNLGGDTKIIGGNASCDCVLPRGLPLDLPAGRTISFKLHFHAPSKPTDFAQDLDLYLDSPGAPINLKLSGRTVNP